MDWLERLRPLLNWLRRRKTEGISIVIYLVHSTSLSFISHFFSPSVEWLRDLLSLPLLLPSSFISFVLLFLLSVLPSSSFEIRQKLTHSSSIRVVLSHISSPLWDLPLSLSSSLSDLFPSSIMVWSMSLSLSIFTFLHLFIFGGERSLNSTGKGQDLSFLLSPYHRPFFLSSDYIRLNEWCNERNAPNDFTVENKRDV